MPRRFQHSFPLLINSNKAPDVGLTEGPGCCITSLEASPARLQIHYGYLLRTAFPQPPPTIRPQAYGAEPWSRGPQSEGHQPQGTQLASKDLDRDCAPAHHTRDNKTLAGPVNGLHLPFVFVARTEGLSLVPDFTPKFNPPSALVSHRADSSIKGHPR